MAGARPITSDYLQNFAFQVETTVGPFGSRLQEEGRPQSGFSNCTAPEVTLDVVEYKEGVQVWKEKYPGIPSTNEITLSKGVARVAGAFWQWMSQLLAGNGDYRATVRIKQFHRADGYKPPVAGGYNETSLETEINVDGPARTYVLFNAFPSRHKLTGDLDAQSSEVSIEEIALQYEQVAINELPIEGA